MSASVRVSVRVKVCVGDVSVSANVTECESEWE